MTKQEIILELEDKINDVRQSWIKSVDYYTEYEYKGRMHSLIYGKELVEKLDESFDNKEKIENMASCMLSILDSLKLFDQGSLDTSEETLSEIMFRKMKAYDIDLNKELGFTHLKPVTKK